VIAICPSLADYVRGRGYSGVLTVIENTLDVDRPPVTDAERDAVRERYGLRDARLAVYTGSLEPYQGLDLLIEAAAMLHESLDDAHFMIVGGWASQIEAMHKLARRHRVADRFTFVPAVPPEDVFLYQELADVLVTTRAIGQNTPLKIYQYLRADRPIVATAIESHTQVLDASCAEMVEPTAEGIAAGLHRVFEDAQYRAELAAGSSRRARERYSKERYHALLAELIYSLPRRNVVKA
jgi:glycosyltransferase involved in cell wall biosynthesis